MDSSSSSSDKGATSTRPYLIRALHEWCSDNGFTPYIAVHVDRHVQVPMEYVSNNEIVLNVGFEATSSLELGNEFISFKARFGGVAREIVVPVDHVVAIYARENGQGMAFPAPATGATGPTTVAAAPAAAEAAATAPAAPARGLRLAPAPASEDETPEDDGPGGSGGGRPALKRIK
ncbi:ClpXP protease specificity-enhancing factor [Burkholderiaceae bacterium UC74_6]